MNGESETSSRRAVVFIGHGGVPRDYPRDRLMRLKALEARRRASSELPCREELELEHEIRHWPRTPASDPYQAGIEAVAARLRPLLAPARLVLAYNEFCAPTVAEAVRALAADGAREIVAMPSMLTPGGVHAEVEIPETLTELRAEFPEVTIRYAWPFPGEHLAQFFAEHLRRVETATE